MDQHSPVPVPATYPSDALDRRLLLGAAGLAGIAALAVGRAQAGPLTPPAGPVVSTGKTITEAEPRIAVNATNTPPSGTNLFVLPGPGSYYLTGNISVPANRTGISMGSGATLDLNGFTITGAGSTSTGILASNGCTVRNGTISNVSGAIVSVNPTVAVYVEDLNVTGFTSRAIDLGSRSVVRRCNVSGTGLVGVEIQGNYGIVEDTTVTNTNGTGVYINSYSVLRRSNMYGCAIGAYIGYASHAESCEFSACSNFGLQAAQSSFVIGCVAIGAAVGVGFELGDRSEAVRCVASACNFGIRASASARVIECSANTCSASGIKCAGAGNTIEGCRISHNSIGVDMTGVSGNYIQKCVFMSNTNALSVNIGGNWYPNVALASTNTATNPLASVIG